MSFRWNRLFIALTFALLAAGLTLVIAQAQDGTPVQPAQQTPACVSCHTYPATTRQRAPGNSMALPAKPVLARPIPTIPKSRCRLTVHPICAPAATAIHAATGRTGRAAPITNAA